MIDRRIIIIFAVIAVIFIVFGLIFHFSEGNADGTTPTISATLRISNDGSGLVLRIDSVSTNSLRVSDCQIRLTPPGGEQRNWILTTTPWDYDSSIMLSYVNVTETGHINQGDELRFSFPTQHRPAVGPWTMLMIYPPTLGAMLPLQWQINEGEANGSVVTTEFAPYSPPVRDDLDGGEFLVLVGAAILIGLGVVVAVDRARSRR